jgi:ABC-type uncharacterized transport system fused permease/ATPase subunit
MARHRGIALLTCGVVVREQQRIAFARALVQKPDWLFLDEATSAVDEATEACLYRLVRERLAGTTVFSVGHRGTLRPLHARQFVVQPNGSGPASIVEVAAASCPAWHSSEYEQKAQPPGRLNGARV